jgi:hypothetical protein
MSDIALSLCIGGMIAAAPILASAFNPEAFGEIWNGFLDGVRFITGRFPRRRAEARTLVWAEPFNVWIDLGPVGALTCPNGPACPHDFDQHRYNPDSDRWYCSVPHCLENPEFTYPTIGVERTWADSQLLHRRSTG